MKPVNNPFRRMAAPEPEPIDIDDNYDDQGEYENDGNMNDYPASQRSAGFTMSDNMATQKQS